MSNLLFALLAPAHAEAVLEFKTTVPVSIFVDGNQATMTGNMRQRVAGLDAGRHALKVNGMFGKTLYEAEIDIPDNTITTASWERGEVKVLSTRWLDEEEEEEASADDTGVEAEETEETDEEDEALIVEAPSEPELPLAVPAQVPAPVSAPVAPPQPIRAPAPLPIAAAPVAATALPPAAASRTLSVSASEGTRVDIVYEGRTLTVVVVDGRFHIQDPSGLEVALGR